MLTEIYTLKMCQTVPELKVNYTIHREGKGFFVF